MAQIPASRSSKLASDLAPRGAWESAASSSIALPILASCSLVVEHTLEQ